MVIYALWGVIGVGILWSAMLKQTNILGGKDEQGRMFGVLEGMRGVFRSHTDDHSVDYICLVT